MKKATIIAALLAALMLIVSCGGGAGGNPEDDLNGGGGFYWGGGGQGGGSATLAGKTFTDFFGDLTWTFGTDGTANRKKDFYNALGGLINSLDENWNYEIADSTHLVLHERNTQGASIGKKILKEYSLNYGRLTISDAIPANKTLSEIAADYWFPEFTSESSSDDYYLKLMDSDDVFILLYRNTIINSESSTYCIYTIDNNTITADTITATKAAAEDGGRADYPETITVTYSTSGSGEDMKIHATTDKDSHSYTLEWHASFDIVDEVQN